MMFGKPRASHFTVVKEDPLYVLGTSQVMKRFFFELLDSGVQDNNTAIIYQVTLALSAEQMHQLVLDMTGVQVHRTYSTEYRIRKSDRHINKDFLHQYLPESINGYPLWSVGVNASYAPSYARGNIEIIFRSEEAETSGFFNEICINIHIKHSVNDVDLDGSLEHLFTDATEQLDPREQPIYGLEARTDFAAEGYVVTQGEDAAARYQEASSLNDIEHDEEEGSVEEDEEEKPPSTHFPEFKS